MISWFFGSWIIYIVHAAFIAGVIGTFFGGIVSNTAITSFTFKTNNEYTLTAGTIKIYGVN